VKYIKPFNDFPFNSVIKGTLLIESSLNASDISCAGVPISDLLLVIFMCFSMYIVVLYLLCERTNE
jgi:hypothetical protein